MQSRKYWLFLNVFCLACLLGMALLAVPAQAKQFAYVTNSGSSSVSVIDTATNTVTATVGVGGRPVAVAITPNGARAYVANSNSNSVSVINTATNTAIATVGVESFPQGLVSELDLSGFDAPNTQNTLWTRTRGLEQSVS